MQVYFYLNLLKFEFIITNADLLTKTNIWIIFFYFNWRRKNPVLFECIHELWRFHSTLLLLLKLFCCDEIPSNGYKSVWSTICDELWQFNSNLLVLNHSAVMSLIIMLRFGALFVVAVVLDEAISSDRLSNPSHSTHSER